MAAVIKTLLVLSHQSIGRVVFHVWPNQTGYLGREMSCVPLDAGYKNLDVRSRNTEVTVQMSDHIRNIGTHSQSRSIPSLDVRQHEGIQHAESCRPDNAESQWI